MITDLFTLTNEHFLTQMIDSPTHRAGNTLDLIFSNNANYIHSYSTHITALSDHRSIECKIHYAKNTPKAIPKKPQSKDTTLYDLNFFSDSINWSELRQSLSEVSWDNLFLKCYPCEMMDTFLSVCLDINNQRSGTPKADI